MKILTIILSALLIFICLLQEDKNDGIMSFWNSNNLSLFNETKTSNMLKYFEYGTWALAIALFIVVFVQMI